MVKINEVVNLSKNVLKMYEYLKTLGCENEKLAEKVMNNFLFNNVIKEKEFNDNDIREFIKGYKFYGTLFDLYEDKFKNDTNENTNNKSEFYIIEYTDKNNRDWIVEETKDSLDEVVEFFAERMSIKNIKEAVIKNKNGKAVRLNSEWFDPSKFDQEKLYCYINGGFYNIY